MIGHIEKLNEKFKRSALNESIHYSYPEELSVYGQAVLKRKSALEVFKEKDFESEGKFNISFSLSGELSGNIVCQFDKDEENFENQSLFTESMNILLGQLFTRLEDTTGLMNMISAPKNLNHSHSFFQSLGSSPRHIRLRTRYEIITLSKIISVDIFLFAQRAKQIEV